MTGPKTMTELRLVKPEPEPWNQLAGEDEAEFLLFLAWLQGSNPRTAPAYPAIASANNWTERANAYDVTHALPTSPTGKAARGFNDLETVFTTEARKLSNDVRKSGATRVLTTKEILALGMVLLENRDAMKRLLDAEEEGVDVSELTEEELRGIQAAHKVLSKMGKKGLA